LAIIPGAREIQRNGDVNYEFRQASDFFFLTGFDEPDAVAVFNPADAKERFVLFVRPRDREMEIWNGRRAGVEGAIATYGALDTRAAAVPDLHLEVAGPHEE